MSLALDMVRDSYVENEQALIGAVLVENRVMDEISAFISPDDFAVTSHELLWRGIQYQYNNNLPIDFLTLSNVLQKYKRLQDVGGLTYLTELASLCPSPSNAMQYAKAIKEGSQKRQGLELAEQIKKITIEQDFDNAEDYYNAVDKLVMKMRPDSTGKLKGFAETEEEYFTFLETQSDNIKTGFKNFDEWSNGVGRGWLYILAGRPSIGKTAKALQMAVGMARQDAGNILIWSQEMTFNQLKSRMLSPVSGVNYGRIRKKTLEEHEKQRLREAHKEINQFPLFVEDSYGVTIEHIRSTARQVRRKHGRIGAIMVDYLTRMDIKQEKGQTWSRVVGEVAKRSKWLAQEMDCPVIMLAQLSREGVTGEPQLHHLRDSGEIEQEADLVEFLWEKDDETSNDGVIVQSHIAKGRDTGVHRFKYLFKGWIQRYEDYNR